MLQLGNCDGRPLPSAWKSTACDAWVARGLPPVTDRLIPFLCPPVTPCHHRDMDRERTMGRFGTGMVVVALYVSLSWHAVHADVTTRDDYTKRLKISQTIDPHGPTPFGEQLPMVSPSVPP